MAQSGSGVRSLLFTVVMSRPLRLEIKDGLYHIFSRGIEKRRIFYEPYDYQKFIDIASSAIPKYKIVVYAYALMNNHYHLLLKTLESNLSIVLHYINTSYVGYFNYKYKRGGHLFQGRYKSILVESDAYLLELSRYIHLQPVKNSIVKNLIDYSWTSYKNYINGGGIVNTSWLTDYFSKNLNNARKEYRRFIEDKIKSYDFEPSRVAYKNIILGSTGFIKKIKENVISTANLSKEITHYRFLKEAYSSQKIINILKNYYKIGGHDLKEKDKKLFEYQRIGIYLLKKYTGLRLKEIGDVFGGRYNTFVSKVYRQVEETKDKYNSLKYLIKKIEDGEE